MENRKNAVRYRESGLTAFCISEKQKTEQSEGRGSTGSQQSRG